MTDKPGNKFKSRIANSDSGYYGRLMPTVLLSVALACATAASADSMMKDSAMKKGEEMMEKTDMKDEKGMMMEKEKGMMKEEKAMMDDGKGMMKEEKAMMDDGKKMMKDDKGMMKEGMK
ncbi:MAG: hypothetical protein KDI74_06090 [Gammaproteobacteria bacterium]|nr:hypothetical protein [Gammaproteobacteria bacterium]